MCDIANFTPAPPKSTSRDWSAEVPQVWVSIQSPFNQTKPNLEWIKYNQLVVQVYPSTSNLRPEAPYHYIFDLEQTLCYRDLEW